MALKKIQDLIEKLSKDPKVKMVISEVQSATKDIQSKMQHMTKEDAVKTYKTLVKKVTAKEGQLQKEAKAFIVKLKKSAVDVEKNLNTYKKKAQAERTKLEKVLKAKAGIKTKSTTKAKPAAKKATAPKKKSAAKK